MISPLTVTACPAISLSCNIIVNSLLGDAEFRVSLGFVVFKLQPRALFQLAADCVRRFRIASDEHGFDTAQLYIRLTFFPRPSGRYKHSR